MSHDRRTVNEYRREKFGKEPARRVAFVCECADERCRRSALLTAAEYDEARSANRAILADGSHVPPSSG